MSFATPLLPTLNGKVYFGENFRLYIVVAGSGVLVKLPGDVKLDPATARSRPCSTTCRRSRSRTSR